MKLMKKTIIIKLIDNLNYEVVILVCKRDWYLYIDQYLKDYVNDRWGGLFSYRILFIKKYDLIEKLLPELLIISIIITIWLKRSFQSASSISPLGVRLQVKSLSSYSMMLCLRLQPTSRLCALEKKDLDLRILSSIGSSLNSCSKEETLLTSMELEESQSTELSLLMKISSSSTIKLASYRWLTLVPTQTDLNSSSLLLSAHGLMESMSSLGKSLKDLI